MNDPTDTPEIRFDRDGLVPAVAQDALTGEVRMVAFMDRAALDATLATGLAHFHSRSRGRLWKKGEESGNVLAVQRVCIDCDADCVLLQVDPAGPTCHTGAPSCFFRVARDGQWVPMERPHLEADGLYETLARRAHEPDTAKRSYTKQLLDAGAVRIGEKLREEADELARAVADESPARVASEAADVLYHLMVGLVSRGVTWRDVLSELRRRSGVSGLAEKASRAPRTP